MQPFPFPWSGLSLTWDECSKGFILLHSFHFLLGNSKVEKNLLSLPSPVTFFILFSKIIIWKSHNQNDVKYFPTTRILYWEGSYLESWISHGFLPLHRTTNYIDVKAQFPLPLASLSQTSSLSRSLVRKMMSRGR